MDNKILLILIHRDGTTVYVECQGFEWAWERAMAYAVKNVPPEWEEAAKANTVVTLQRTFLEQALVENYRDALDAWREAWKKHPCPPRVKAEVLRVEEAESIRRRGVLDYVEDLAAKLGVQKA